MIDNYEMVDHPKHYQKEGKKECWDEMVDIFGAPVTAVWCFLTVFKYHYRAGAKPGESEARDNGKIAAYVAKGIELMNKSGSHLARSVYHKLMEAIKEW